MPSILHGALGGSDYTALAGPATPRWYLSVVNSTEQATALINQASFTYPVPTLTVDTVSGNWGSVAAGQTVAIGTQFLGRVRKAGNSTTLHIGETSEGDPGLITHAIRNAGFADNQAITVYLKRRDIWSVIPRIVMPAGTIYEDYDAVEGTEHSTPPCIVNITFNSTDRRAGFVDAGQTYRTVQFDAAEELWPTSSSVASRLWTAPAAWGAPTAGSTTAASVTYQVPQSAENYEIQYAATDNNGIVSTVFRQVWAHGRTGATAPYTLADWPAPTWDETGLRLTVTLLDDDLTNIPVGAMVVVWYDSGTCFNGGDITTAATQFVGWVVRVTELTEPGLRGAEVEIVGTTAMLERLGAYSQWLEANASPDTWQELVSSLEYTDFLVWWVAWRRAKNIVECFNYQIDGHGNLTARLPQWRIDASGNLLSQMRQIAESYRCNVGANPDGSIIVKKRTNLVTYSSRSALITRAAFTSARYRTAELTHELRPRCRRMRGEGFFWNGATELPTPHLSDAPGDAPGQGVSDERLQGQTVDSQSDLNIRTGLAYADANNPYPDGTIQIDGFWPVVFPAEQQFCSLNIPSTLRPDNTTLAINIIPRSVSLRPNGDGTYQTIIAFRGETSGVAGITVPVPTQATPDNPYLQAPELTPPVVTVGSRDGSEVIGMTTTHLAYTVNARSGTVNWTPIAKPAGVTSLWDLQLDPFSPLFQSGSGAIRAYLMTNLGLYYHPDLLSGVNLWVLKDSLYAGGITYGEIRTPPIPGRVYVLWGSTGELPGPETPTHVERLDNYGATPIWNYSHGTNFGAGEHGFDCDQYGSDEVLFGTRHNVQGAKLWRVVGGVATAVYSGTFAFDQPNFIQKPLKTLTGANNNSTGSSELIYFASLDLFRRSSDGGANWSTVTTINSNIIRSGVSSVIFTDDAEVIALPVAQGTFKVSEDGTNFTTPWASQTDFIGQCGGFFPRRVNGAYRYYSGGGSKLVILDDMTVSSFTDITGDWASAVGTLSGTYFIDIVPLS